MESKPVSIKQKESLVTILIDNIPIQISTDQYNHLLEWIDRYHRYQIGMEIYPLESNIYKQYAIKSKIALETLKKLNIPLKTKLKMKNLVHLFLAILYYLTISSFIIVILFIGY